MMMARNFGHLLLAGLVSSVLVADNDATSMLQTSASISGGEKSTIALFRRAPWQQVFKTMLASPHDPVVQKYGCRTLTRLVPSHRAELLTATVINPTLDAIVNHVADLEVVYTCFGFIRAFHSTFDRPTTLAINNGTHIADAVATVLRFYPHDRSVQRDVLLHVAEFSTFVACETQPPFVDAGCMDLVWDAMDNFPGRENSDVQMSGWQGFSDHAYCLYSAQAIASHSGKNDGIQRIVHALEEAIGNDFRPAEERGGGLISLQYEIMAVANGLLQNSNAENGFFATFVDSGYGEMVLKSLHDQPEERSANDRGCAALELLSMDEAVRSKLLAAGALEVIVAAMNRYKTKDHTIFVNAEMGDMYPVLPRCDGALRNFAKNNSAVQDALLELGVLEIYGSMRKDLLVAYPDMGQMPVLLRARQESKALAAH